MLTNAAAKAAGAKSRAYKLTDQGGLFLLIRPTGTKSWQQKYRWRGREKLLTIGQFPDVNVNRARILQAEAKEQLEQGIDPSRGRAKIDTLEELARSWYQSNLPAWSPEHAADVIGSLERSVFPELGNAPVGSITAPQLLAVVETIEAQVTAHRVRQRLSEIFAFGKAKGLVDSNPASDLGAALLSAPPAQPHAAVTTIEECRALLGACERDDRARATTVLASRFLALTGVRWAAVRDARWEQFDFAAAVWTVPAALMKLSKAKKGDPRFDHSVPLSTAALETLRRAERSMEGDGSCLVFTGRSGGQLGDGVIRELYARTSFAGRHVPHGWRASFSTILNEDLGPDWRFDIDAALGHAGKGKVEAAYNRSVLLKRRRAVFDRWGELLGST